MYSLRTLEDAPYRSGTRRVTLLVSATLLLLTNTCLVLPISAQQLYSPQLTETFPVGPNPYGLAFDGANIWVTSAYSDEVTKLRASDGAFLGTFPAGGKTLLAAFDGTFIWVTNYLNDTVSRLRASDGALEDTFNVGSYPTGILFDGTNIWVSAHFGNTVTKLRASDGAVLGVFNVSSPGSLVSDGANVWITNSSD
ncbi:MAG: hypothetical protein ABI787_09555, partial [Spartobacteria bacterium]